MQRRVLIVEDEMVVGMHLERIVCDLGHRVIGTAASSREALAVAEREAPDLALMDIHLAGSDDGVDTAKVMCDRYACAVVFITAYADPATIERTGPVGAAGYLVKPFTTAAVRAAISTAFSSHGRLSQTRQREHSLASALASLGDAIFVTDEEGRISFANSRAAEWTGWSTRELPGRDLLEVVRLSVESDASMLREALKLALHEKRPEILPRVELVARNGGERVVGLEIEPVQDEDRRAGGVVLSVRGPVQRPAARPPAMKAPRRPFGSGTRLLVYSHDTLGLGHLRRSLNLIRALCARHPGLSALLVTGSPLVHRYPMPTGADYIKLPAIRKVAPEEYEPRSLFMSGPDIRTLRSNLLLRTIHDFEPNVLLVDHSPIGSKGELLPSLEWLRTRGTCTCILGLRDVIDEPRTVIQLWKENGVYDVLRDHYHHVVVYGAREVYDVVRQYEFPEEVVAKTRFVHYVCDPSPSEAAEETVADARPVVVVSVGGGDGGGETVLLPFLEMMRRFSGEIDFRAEILMGPFVSPDLERRLRAQAWDLPAALSTFVSSTAGHFRRADLVVSTAGYNTVTELLANARRAILIPRVLHRQEQVIRARRMEELGLVACLHPDDVSPVTLFEAVRRARASPEEPLVRGRAEGVVPLDGAERFSEFCRGLLVESRRED